MVLWPKPAICGKMNHIQWVRLFAAVQFFDDPGVHGSLRLHEANEIRIGHEGSVACIAHQFQRPQDGENLRLPGHFVLLRSRKRADGSRHLV